MAEGGTHWRFVKAPELEFIQRVRAHIKETGQPETLPELFHGKIPKDTIFTILEKIDVPRNKRPDGDLAPCPMCASNKFLDGRLVHFPSLECVALIGHDCADREISRQAEEEWARKRQENEELDFLLSVAPVVPAMLAALTELRPLAEGARDLFLRFRKKAASVHRDLRRTIAGSGQLEVAEVISSQMAAVGPAGFRGSSGVQTRAIVFGVLQGTTAVRTEFDPVRPIDMALEHLRPLLCGSSQDAIIEFVYGLEPKDRTFAVGFIKEAGRTYAKVTAMLSDFRDFFDRDNLANISAWGAHENSINPVKVVDREVAGQREVLITGTQAAVVLKPDPELWTFSARWPEIPQ